MLITNLIFFVKSFDFIKLLPTNKFYSPIRVFPNDEDELDMLYQHAECSKNRLRTKQTQTLSHFLYGFDAVKLGGVYVRA